MTSTDLPELARALEVARADVEAARRTRPAPGVPAAAAEQRRLLEALESYAAALTHHGRPVPYRLHSELAMYQAMFDIRRNR
jgi:hypothetical protein